MAAPPVSAAWRKAVLDRDGHRCTECGASEHLAAHHILSRKEHPELSEDVSNGRTLCHGCHSRAHPENTAWVNRLDLILGKGGKVTWERHHRLPTRSLTPETIRKMSVAAKGNKHLLGHKHSPATRTKLSAAGKGNKRALGHRGWHHSLESRIKISVATKSHWSDEKIAIRMSRVRGWHHSAESRAKISASRRRSKDDVREGE